MSRKYIFTGVVYGGFITALEKPDDTRNYIDLYDTFSSEEVREFDEIWGSGEVTIELKFNKDKIKRTKVREWTVIGNIKSLWVIDYD